MDSVSTPFLYIYEKSSIRFIKVPHPTRQKRIVHLRNQVISSTGFESPCSVQETIYGGRATASPLWKPHRSFDFAQDGELAEPLCAHIKRWGFH